jgi:hypothetical protein
MKVKEIKGRKKLIDMNLDNKRKKQHQKGALNIPII